MHNEDLCHLYSSSNIWMTATKRVICVIQEDEGATILQKVGLYSLIDTVSHSRRLESSHTVYFYQKSQHRNDSILQHVTYLWMVVKYFTVHKQGDKLSEFPCYVEVTMNLKLCHNTISYTTD
jgi:hypothetical protein